MGGGLNVTRLADGTIFYEKTLSAFGGSQDPLTRSLTNIGLFVPMDILCSTFSRARVSVLDKDGKVLENDPFTLLLKDPNFSQSQTDFLYKHLWFKSLGRNITRVLSSSSTNPNDITKVMSLEHLIPNCINDKEINKMPKMKLASSDKRELLKREIEYKTSGTSRKIPLSELAFFYDIANGMTDDSYFSSPSRITALEPTLCNIEEAQRAKNINLKFSAKFLTSNRTMDMSVVQDMSAQEKRDVENILYNKDVHASNYNLDVKSLANDFSKLLYDDSTASDMAKAASLFGINSDTINWWAAGQSTYDNRIMGYLDLIQGSIQFAADDFANTWATYFGYHKESKTIKLSYDHMPAMAVMEEKRLEAKERKSKMLEKLIKSNVPYEQAMIICELDKELKDDGKNR
ncbi:hypothetical protein ACJRPK_13875 [Aquimarina sp. 2-A2]|uniref:hypothetical protein n=1 Tax=Aquimarina sp. 2-A2 TaxID=3382644 RepID=UPI00387F28BC